jgi:hypothetical protein
MATDASKVRVAVTGAVYFDSANTATAPTGTASATTGFVDLGYISEDGVVPRHARRRRHHLDQGVAERRHGPRAAVRARRRPDPAAHADRDLAGDDPDQRSA